jgi:hypothetical protein
VRKEQFSRDVRECSQIIRALAEVLDAEFGGYVTTAALGEVFTLCMRACWEHDEVFARGAARAVRNSFNDISPELVVELSLKSS